MVAEYIFLGIFIVSFLGVLAILAKKAPALRSLHPAGTTGIKKHRIVADLEGRIKDIGIAFEKQVFLHKLLSWVKIIVLKIEVKVDHLLHNLRKKAQKVDQELKNK